MSRLADTQLAFTAHVRDPEHVAGPPDIEPRRMKIYQDLVYRNLEGFIRNAFPVIHSLVSAQDWHTLVHTFLVDHRATTPYFLEISQEFLQFLQRRAGDFAFLPPFALELAHYEWMELALDVAPEELPTVGVDPDGDLLSGQPVVNPLVWMLAYHYPVHRIRQEFQPSEPLAQPIYLAVYRDRQDRVRFFELNAVTARLLELLRHAEGLSGEAVLQQLASELPQLASCVVVDNGATALATLRSLDILLGTEPAAPSA